MNAKESIDTGDYVKHGPTGESWVVAYVRGDRLAWCGWPEGEASLEHCTLIQKAAPGEREKLLQEMTKCSGARGTYARWRLSQEAT